MQKDHVSWLYPPLEARRVGRMKVSELHEIHWEESGNPLGKPVVFLHGGPGGCTSPEHRRFFDPRAWRIVMLDQRGCGKSTPWASIEENTTWHLVEDLERLRALLGIERWTVFGGSWGSTLALAYAERHPERVSELVLRGIFLLRRAELAWFYEQGGASWIHPDAWEHYLAAIPVEERGGLMRAYAKRLFSDDPAVHMPAARAWSIWEGATSKLLPDAAFAAAFGADDKALAFARIECHYFVNGGFFEVEDQLLRDAARLARIPTTIVQGRYDMVCPMRSAHELAARMPHADFVVVPDAGHSAFEPGISRALVAATDKYALL